MSLRTYSEPDRERLHRGAATLVVDPTFLAVLAELREVARDKFELSNPADHVIREQAYQELLGLTNIEATLQRWTENNF